MPKTKEQKRRMLADIIDKIKKAKSLTFTGFDRLTVAENQALREKLKEQAAEFLVAKKTITNIALREAGVEKINVREMQGKIALVFGYEDEVMPVKILDKFKKEIEGELQILGGLLGAQVLNAAEAENLAKIPSKPELQAKVVGCLNAPMSGFANVLSGPMRGLVYALNAIKEQKS